MPVKTDSPRIQVSASGAELLFNTKIFDLEAVMNACYSQVEQYYFYFDEQGKDGVRVVARPKQKTPKAEIEKMAWELQNQALAEMLRLKLSVRNKSIRAAIVEQAISSALSAPKLAEIQDAAGGAELDKLNEELNKILAEAGGMNYEDDPLKIAVPIEQPAKPARTASKNAKKTKPRKKQRP